MMTNGRRTAEAFVISLLLICHVAAGPGLPAENAGVVHLRAAGTGGLQWLPDEIRTDVRSRAVYWVGFPDAGAAAPQRASLSLPSVAKVLDSSAQGLSLQISLPGMTVAAAPMEDGRVYSAVRANGAGTGAIGKPDLPVFGQWILVPNGTTVSLRIEPGTPLIFGNVDIPPVQPPQSGSGSTPPFTQDASTYLTNADYPGLFAEAEPVRKMRGQDCTVLWIYPYQYNPVQRMLYVYPDLVVHVDFRGAAQPVPSGLQSDEFREMQRRVAVNAPAVQAAQEQIAQETEQAAGRTGETISVQAGPDGGSAYLIVCDPGFFSAANDLARWKRLKGFPTDVVTTAVTGKTAAGIQNYLKGLARPPVYLLLLGDSEFIECFYRATHVGDTGMVNGVVQGKIASDRYYALLDGDSDVTPDLSVGRLPVNTAAEAATVVQKIINYERTPPTAPGSTYYAKAALVAEFEELKNSQGNGTGQEKTRFVKTSEDVRQFLTGRAYRCQRIYDAEPGVTPRYWSSKTLYRFENDQSSDRSLPSDLLPASGFQWNGSTADVSSAINGGVSLVLYRGHGTRLFHIDDQTYYRGGWSDPELRDRDPSGLNRGVQALLSNGPLVPVIWSITCETGWFDNEKDSSTYDQLEAGVVKTKLSTHLEDECLCEELIRDSDGGAVGVIGATRDSFSQMTDRLTWGLMDAIWPTFIEDNHGQYGDAEPIYEMGRVLDYGKTYLQTTFRQATDAGYVQTTLDEFHWFGDPSMEMWTGVPATMTVQMAPSSLVRGQATNVTVTVRKGSASVAGARVTISNPDVPSDYWTGKTNASGSVTFSVTPTQAGNYHRVVTAHNCLPVEDILVVGGATTPTPTPSITTLVVNGATVQGNISPAGDPDWYQFTVASPAVYVIETWPGTLLDNRMFLYGPNSQTTLVEDDDDDGQDAAAKIERSLAPGTYYVKIQAYSASATGVYTIRVTTTTSGGGGCLSGGSILLEASGEISKPAESDWYEFTVVSAPPETYYTIETTAGTLTDTLIRLYGPDGRQHIVEEDNDHGEGLASKIFRKALPPGVYYVEVLAYYLSGTGTYSIRAFSCPDPPITPLVLNGPAVDGELLHVGDAEWFRFEAPSAGMYTVTTQAGTLADNFIYLYGPNSRRIPVEQDDDSGPSLAAQFSKWLFPGTYYVKVEAWRYAPRRTGTYTIRVVTGTIAPQ